MKSLLLKSLIGLILVAGGLTVFVMSTGGVAYWHSRFGGPPTTSFRTSTVTRDNLLASISASGTVEPEEVIDVGAQVVGQIKEFGEDREAPKLPNGRYRPIDFRSRVKEGTVLAKLDDALFKARLDKAQADLLVAETQVKLTEIKFRQAERDWKRTQALSASKGISEQDYENAGTAYYVATREQEIAKHTLKGARAAHEEAQKNMEYTTITSPVDGEIIDRRVNVGQTVVSGLNAPSLFLIAKDLKKMQVWASINEADIGHIHKQQQVQFTVDAYPNRPFYGTVSQIRLNANMTQNVVTYTVVVDTDNSSGDLNPYMTANLQFKVEERKNVLQVPNAALRFKPQPQLVCAEYRDAYVESQQRRPGGGKEKGGSEAGQERQSHGTVWVRDQGFLRPVQVRTGLTDQTNIEIVSGDLAEGDEIVTGEVHAVAAEESAGNPFTPKFQNNRK
jgi:HlyD family secretion protein